MVVVYGGGGSSRLTTLESVSTVFVSTGVTATNLFTFDVAAGSAVIEVDLRLSACLPSSFPTLAWKLRFTGAGVAGGFAVAVAAG